MTQETLVRIRIFSTAALAAVVSFALILPLSGCGVKDTQTFKSTRRLYYTYVNTPAKLDLEDPASLGNADRRLAARLMNIDAQLTALERSLDALSGAPDQAVADGLMRRFPWLSTLVMVDSFGNILASMPTIPLKNLQFEPLLEVAPKAGLRDLRVDVQDTPLGPEVLVARPFQSGGELKMLLVATFDFRALLPYVTMPDDLIVLTPDILLWSGDLYYSETSLAGVDWKGKLSKDSWGATSGPGKMVWLTRYLGRVPLVFATPAG